MIVVENVSREFTNKRAKGTPKQVLQNVSFHIPKGEIVGIIGSNGAGKSTLIKLMTGLLIPSSGTIHTLGVNPVKYQRKVAEKASIVFGNTSNLIEDAVVEESFFIAKKMYHMSDSLYRERFKWLNQMLDLNEMLNKKKEELSLGELRRANLAMGLLPKSEIILLDEAMIGMDSLHKQKVIEFLKKLNQEEQVTMIITSQNLEDIKKLCTRVLVIHNHTVRYYGTIEYLERHYAFMAQITIVLADKIPDMEDLAIQSYAINNLILTISYNRTIISAKTIINHVLQQCEITDISFQEKGLEEALINMQTYQQNDLDELMNLKPHAQN